MNREEIDQKIREIIADRTNDRKVLELGGDDPLASLGIDSLAFSWILADMEDAFDFVIMGSDIMKLKTINLAVGYIEGRLAK